MEETELNFSPSRKLNFVIGICAILISLASFYATYLQAQSAEQQVKAMTYPMIQHFTNNYDLENRESAINLVLTNSGVGPAIIRNVTYHYQGNEFNYFYDFLVACCKAEYEAFKQIQSSKEAVAKAQIITAADRNIILAANDHTQTFYLLKHESNQEFWEKLNKERRKLKASVCYCSLLDNCYLTKGVGAIKEVEACGKEKK